jgi:signal transduction histidine kinase
MTRRVWFALSLLAVLSLVVGVSLSLRWPAQTVPLNLALALALFLLFLVVVLAVFAYLTRTQTRELERQRAEAESRAEQARRLWQAGLQVTAAPDYAETLRVIVDRARELVGGEAAAFCVWDEPHRWWVTQGTGGAGEAFDVSVRRVETRERPVECPVIRFKYRTAHLDVPVVHDGQVLGCLCIANQQPREFSPQEREMLAGVASQAAVALQNARRLERAGSHAVAGERERLAREMHDTLAQLLGFVAFKVQATREFLIQGRIELAEEQLDQLLTISQELYADTRELILGLRTTTGPQRELMPALQEYAERFSQLSGIPTTLEPDGIADVQFPPLVEVQLLRVVQEALSNVRKHARASHARVRFERAAEFARVTVEDDGQGFDPAQSERGPLPRFGLQSMRERIESINGTLTIWSAPRQGTKITVQVPIVYRGD